MNSEKKPPFLSEKITVAVGCISLALTFLVCFLDFIGICENHDLFVPLSGITMLCYANLEWNVNRRAAHFSLGIAIFAFVVCALGLLANSVIS